MKTSEIVSIANAGYVTVKEYAEMKGTTVQAVYMAIKQKRLQSKKSGSFTFVRE